MEGQRRQGLRPRPVFDPDSWQFVIGGLVENEVRLTWHEFVDLPAARVQAEQPRAEGRSVVGIEWEGPRVGDLLGQACPVEEGRFVFVSCAGGYSMTLPLELALWDDVVIARLRDGQPIPDDEGGPLQLVVPGVYAGKWVRWVQMIEVLAEDRLGYWECRRYSKATDVWQSGRRA